MTDKREPGRMTHQDLRSSALYSGVLALFLAIEGGALANRAHLGHARPLILAALCFITALAVGAHALNRAHAQRPASAIAFRQEVRLMMKVQLGDNPQDIEVILIDGYGFVQDVVFYDPDDTGQVVSFDPGDTLELRFGDGTVFSATLTGGTAHFQALATAVHAVIASGKRAVHLVYTPNGGPARPWGTGSIAVKS